MKTIFKILAMTVVSSFVTLSCSQMDDIVNESDEVIRENSLRHVYFGENTNTTSYVDSMIFSFGLLLEDEQVITIPVSVTGLTPTQNVALNFSIVDSATTATEGVHFVSVSDTSKYVPAGQFTAQVPMTLRRGNLPDDEDISVKVVLELHSNDYTLADITDRKLYTVYITNYLQEPYIWNGIPYYAYLKEILGEYEPAKYRKLLEYYDYNTSFFNTNEGILELFGNPALHVSNAYKVKDFFLANPQYGYTAADFPDESTISSLFKRPYAQ